MPSPKQSAPAACACTTVKKVSRVLGRAYDAALEGSGATVTQLAVLRRILRMQGEPLSHVAAALELDRSTLYRAITPMVRDGWLTLSSGTDARSRRARLTQKGRALLARANGDWDVINERVLTAFGRAQWQALVGELNRLAECAAKRT